MKKFTGRYTTNTAKALKGSERILCQVSEDGTIYICNGFLLCTMNAPESAATSSATFFPFNVIVISISVPPYSASSACAARRTSTPARCLRYSALPRRLLPVLISARTASAICSAVLSTGCA